MSAVELTPQQKTILRLVAKGKTNAEIAKELFLGTNTIKTHLQHAYYRLGVHDRGEAVAEARRLNQIPEEDA